MTSLKTIVNVGGGVVGTEVVLSISNDLVVLDGKEKLACLALTSETLALSCGAPGVPAILSNGEKELKLMYVGKEMDDFFYCLRYQLSQKKRKIDSSSSFYGASEASWRKELIQLR
jgi:hypothetical protein